jgi:hypothetical protein
VSTKAGQAQVARLDRGRQSESPDLLGVSLISRHDEARDGVEAVLSSEVERRLLPVVPDRRSGAALQEQANHLHALVQDRIHKRRVADDGRLLVDEGPSVEQQQDDVGVAGLRRFVQRRYPHARLDRAHLRSRRQQKRHHLRLTHAGSDHQGREPFGVGAVHRCPRTKKLDDGGKVTAPDRGVEYTGTSARAQNRNGYHGKPRGFQTYH